MYQELAIIDLVNEPTPMHSTQNCPLSWLDIKALALGGKKLSLLVSG